ncbi:unnamed protein product [Rhizoctonia solani]|uniref:Uncharacterized protein n=1 Tax=Rhizoctonia solani TaxID=456999 RepID=A0A8H2Y345_9AGAM|nr:unnamed protein product [Rhizoctonia solani]
MDRLWTPWQARNKTHLWYYGENTVQKLTANAASLSDEMKYMRLDEVRSVESLMYTLSNDLCYKVCIVTDAYESCRLGYHRYDDVPGILDWTYHDTQYHFKPCIAYSSLALL